VTYGTSPPLDRTTSWRARTSGCAIEQRAARGEARRLVLGYVAIVALLLAIWVLTGAGYFWPVWPAMGMGFGTAARVRATLAGEQPGASPRPYRASFAGCQGRASRLPR
jgi:hypothetical protein